MHKIQDFSYHNHTTFSDGANTLEEMVDQAIKIGYTEMGISDHLIVHKNIDQSLSWPIMTYKSCSDIYLKDFKSNLSSYQKHCDKIRKMSKEKGIKLYVGFEVDFFTYDGWLEELKEFLSQLDYDYLVSGNHFFSSENGEEVFLIHKSTPQLISQERLMELIKIHFNNICKSIDSGLYAFVAHLDYVRKVGDQYFSAQRYWDDICAVLAVLQKHGIATEISTKGLRKSGDYYPSVMILQEIAKRNIKMVISDDAHRIEELGYDFAKAEECLEKYGISNRLRF